MDDAKRKRFDDVVRIVHETCEAKGWESSTASQDSKNWRYATITVSRLIGGRAEGTIDITINNVVTLKSQKPPFQSYSLKDLVDSIYLELNRLPWLKAPEKNVPTVPVSRRREIENLIRRFHVVYQQLKRRHNNRDTLNIKDEYDVQDLLHALLKTIVDDIRPEEHTPSYAGGAARMDFLLKEHKIVIETKMLNQKLTDKLIGEQLLIDIQRYQRHPDCKTLICFIYDPDTLLKNPNGLVSDLSRKHGDLEVLVIVVPS